MNHCLWCKICQHFHFGLVCLGFWKQNIDRCTPRCQFFRYTWLLYIQCNPISCTDIKNSLNERIILILLRFCQKCIDLTLFVFKVEFCAVVLLDYSIKYLFYFFWNIHTEPLIEKFKFFFTITVSFVSIMIITWRDRDAFSLCDPECVHPVKAEIKPTPYFFLSHRPT